MFRDFLEKTKEGLGETRNKKFTHNQVNSNNRIVIMQKIAPNFGVTIQVLAEEGKEYSHQYTNNITGQIETYTGTVPKGKSYIRIGGQKRNISDFWNALPAEEKS